MDPQIASAEFYRQLGTWLKALGEHALAQADHLEEPAKAPGDEPAIQDAPAQWLAAFSSGPPDHWLRLVEQAGAAGWISDQDLSGQDSPSPPLADAIAQVSRALSAESGQVELRPSVQAMPSTPGARPHMPEPRPEVQTAEQPPAVTQHEGRGEGGSGEFVHFGKSVAGHARQPMQPDEGTASSRELVVKPAKTVRELAAPEVQIDAPVESIPIRPVTRLRLRTRPKSSTTQREPTAELEARANPAPAAHAASIKQDTVDNALPPPTPEAGAKARGRARTKLRRKAKENQAAAPPQPLPDAEPEAPTEEPVDLRKPIYAPRPATLPAPPHWSAVSGHWPDLPRRDLRSGTDTGGENALERRQRLDEEQQGRPWNA